MQATLRLRRESEQEFDVMANQHGACEECARICQLLHGSRRDLKPMVSRFFKVMIGLDVKEALFLPPKFVKNLKDLVGQEIILEDSRGICWMVTLSHYKGSVAFHKGWYQFSVGKDLKVGDFLVFNYIKGGHFVVLEFGRDGCQKPNAVRRPTAVERAWTSEMMAAENTPCLSTHKDARKAESSRTSVQLQPTTTTRISDSGENREQLCMNNELYLMVDRGSGYVQTDHRTWLFDLSSFEMQQNRCSAGLEIEEYRDGQEVSPDVAQEIVKFQSDGALKDKSTNDIVVSTMETAITTNTNIVGDDNDPQPIISVQCDDVPLDDLPHDHPLSAASVRCAVIQEDDMSNLAILPQIPNNGLPQSSQNQNRDLKNEVEMVKKVKVEIMEGTYDCDQNRAIAFEPLTRGEDGNYFATSEMNKAEKTVPVDSLAVLSTVATNFTCLVETNDSTCIELPGRWPSIALPSNGEGRATVVLEDPNGREWGGIYREVSGFYLLLAPWHAVNAENCIQPGDHLVFSMADASLKKYKFDIVRKRLK